MIDLWVYLESSPLLFLTATLIAYVIGDELYKRVGQKAWCHPVVVAILLLIMLLKLTNTPYKMYFSGAQFVHFLLGPATVALAVPLYHNLPLLKKYWKHLTLTLVIGSVGAVAFSVLPVWLLGGSKDMMATLAPKSITTPVAMAVSQQLGGIPQVTAVMVILTGIVGAITGPVVLSMCRVTDPIARGLALGVSAHGIGTARALQMNAVEGAFGALGMGINAAFTALWLPLLVAFVAL